MPKLDRYLLGDFVQSFAATLVVLVVVGTGGVLVDILGNIADGRLPASLMFSQLGLQFVTYLPLILPLALLLGLLLALARLYRDSEMAVLMSIGVGPARLLRPILMLVVPVVALVAASSLWLGPWANRTAEAMVEQANRSVVIAGLEAGTFTTMSNGGIVYLASVSPDGRQMGHVFMQRNQGGRIDVVTAQRGHMYFEGKAQRYLRLEDGYRVNAPADGAGLDYRVMRYGDNEVALPDSRPSQDENDPEMLSTPRLFGDARPEAQAELQRRIAPPLLALAFALLTLPLSRSSPRQQRYGRMMVAFLAYLVATNLTMLGAQWLAHGKIPATLGLWWLTLPLLALSVWLYARDGRLGRPRRAA
jgi:lipopolysaccharide export system permease protein